MPSKVLAEIPHPFPNFNGITMLVKGVPVGKSGLWKLGLLSICTIFIFDLFTNVILDNIAETKLKSISSWISSKIPG